MATQRELHFIAPFNKIEYWESHGEGAEWSLVPNDIGDEWNGDSYSYTRWENIPSIRQGNYPPREQHP